MNAFPEPLPSRCEILGEMVSIGTLIAFALVCLAVPVMRRLEPDAPRPFHTPGSPYLPIAGLAVYALYGRRHARLRQPEPSPTREQ